MVISMPDTEKNRKEKSSVVSRIRRWLPALALGVFCGMLLIIADVSRAVSYLSDEPETCVNCHVMNTQYATWRHSGHFKVATCNDCHVPHDNFFSHYYFKAKDGLRHASMFALRLEPQVIRLSEDAVDVIEENCRRCHQHAMQSVTAARGFDHQGLRCWQCHREVPHGTVRSLSATPQPMRPELPKPGMGLKSLTIGKRTPRAEE